MNSTVVWRLFFYIQIRVLWNKLELHAIALSSLWILSSCRFSEITVSLLAFQCFYFKHSFLCWDFFEDWLGLARCEGLADEWAKSPRCCRWLRRGWLGPASPLCWRLCCRPTVVLGVSFTETTEVDFIFLFLFFVCVSFLRKFFVSWGKISKYCRFCVCFQRNQCGWVFK